MSTRPLFLTLLLSAAALHAADTAPAKTEPAPETYQLKNRSTFACASEEGRVPFWPIGWVHHKGVASMVAQTVGTKTPLDERSFHLTSVLLGSGATPSLAVINGRAYSEGEFLKMPRGPAAATAAPTAAPGGTAPGKTAAPATARIRVQRISDGSVVLQREDQTVTVAMQRQELTQRKIEDPLIDDER